MAIPQFLAMTGAEMARAEALPSKIAWMACHFSPYATGLSNIPRSLPAGSMLILNDRTPVCGHDPSLVAQTLAMAVENFRCDCVLMDLQRPEEPETAKIVQAVIETLPCPVGVTTYYAQPFHCPVLLPPVPPYIPLEAHLAPWQGREIWMELAPEGVEIRVTPEGSRYAPLLTDKEAKVIHHDPALHCHYDITVEQKQIQFRLYRTQEDLKELPEHGEKLGVTRCVGLYQEFRNGMEEGKQPQEET